MFTSKLTRRQAEIRGAMQLMKRLLLGLRGRLDEELRPQDVTAAQLKLLEAVRVHPGASGAQLARYSYVTPQTAQAMLHRAVQRGWVQRGKDERNHRLVTASLTPAGELLLAEADKLVKMIEADLWRGMATEDFAALNALLERGLANLTRIEDET
jgi:DNA-binding MarR family transcriptional regulator